MELCPEVIQMELDLRGSVLCEETVKESGKGQRLTELNTLMGCRFTPYSQK